ncbi:response regulator transcription factor [Arabiibacter massiliensis]|uniref:response regulator transcription factor n=1 Tax=Arabiibacter massiliensis TaxID=1870985 RepID=UPI00155A92A7|nr:helix-turn-helix transcriptional regulator [Arabiibacter massiliensis]
MASAANRFACMRGHLRAVTLADVFDVRVLGLALSLAWSSVTFFSTVVHFSTRNDVSHFNSVVGFSSLGMLAVLVAAALLPRLFARVMSARAVRWSVPGIMAAMTVVLVVVDHDVFRQPWCSIAATCAGAGLGVLYLAWADEFRKLDAAQSVVKAVCSFLLAAVAFALVVALPRELAVVLTVLMPLVAGAVLFARIGAWREMAPPEPSTLRRGAFSIRAVLSIGALALSESFMRALFLNASPIINEGSYPWLFLVASMASVALICGPLFSARELDFGAAYQATVFALGFIFLLLPILDLGTVPADILALVSYSTVTMLTWIVLTRIIGLYRLSTLFAFGIGWSAYVAGSLAGTFGAALLSSFWELEPRVLSIVELVCVCLLFFAYLFLFNERSMMRLLGGPSGDDRRPFRARCEQVAREHELTAREAEIMVLVAKGRSTPRIQKQLGLTAGTVNTHLAHLYRKLDVHDKQELIDLLEERRGEARPEAQAKSAQ